MGYNAGALGTESKSKVHGVVRDGVISIALIGALIVSTLGCKENTKTEDNSYSLSRLVSISNSKNIVKQSAYTPKTGVYPRKVNYINSQIDKMITDISSVTGVESWKVKVIYRLLDISPVYTDKAPNIYTDLCVNELCDGSLFEVIPYENVVGTNKQVVNGDRRRVADVAYSAVNAFKNFEIQNTVANDVYLEDDVNVKGMTPEDREYIKFSLNVLDFFNMWDYKAQYVEDYKNIVDGLKHNNTTAKLLYADNSSNIKINKVLVENMVDVDRNEYYSSLLGNVLSGNEQFINETTFEKDYTEPSVPEITTVSGKPQFKYLEFTRQNMMIAATSLVGKVRYIWGGGHGGGAQIAGANPLWEKFNDAYKTLGIEGCIMSSSGSCPVHGNRACAYADPSVRDIDDYIYTWEKQMSKAGIENALGDVSPEMMYNVFRDRDCVGTYSSQYMHMHGLDGLDCSGFACWVYNQVDAYSVKDCTAVNFVDCEGVERVKYGSELYPGDAIGWDTHIVVVFGKFAEDCYIVVEQTPNVLRFGACSMNGGSSSLAEAQEYANELNRMAGVEENAIKRDLDNYRGRSLGIARVDRAFDDEGVIIDGYGKPFEELTAREIVEIIGYGQ